MAGPALSVARLRALLGADALVADAAGALRVAPRTEAACALLLQTASSAGWRVRLEGAGTWAPTDAPADVVLTTTAMDRITDVSPVDLVATVEAGVRIDELRDRLADAGAWLAADPPGGNRTLGSVVATGTGGPLRTGFGGMRDQLLGVTLITGDGRIVRAGGRVVKNVAGYDLTRLAAGSFGMFGLITSAHLRLRAVPRADRTLLAMGDRDALLDAGRAMLAAGAMPAALELFSPAAADRDAWLLAARLVGTDPEVHAWRDELVAAATVPLADGGPDGAAVWRRAAAAAVDAPVTLRLGTLPVALEDALDLVAHLLDEAVRDWIAVSIGPGAVRWSGNASAATLAVLRRTAAEREVPMTLERAPWPIHSEIGVFGAYREGAGRLVDGLRRQFDPAGALV